MAGWNTPARNAAINKRPCELFWVRGRYLREPTKVALIAIANRSPEWRRVRATKDAPPFLNESTPAPCRQHAAVASHMSVNDAVDGSTTGT